MTIVPANEPRYLEKAPELECDVVTIDLQDSVVRIDKAKVAARAEAVAAIKKNLGKFKAREVCVRPNSPGSQWFVDDVKAVVEAGCDSIRLTHAYGVADVLFAERCIMAYANGRDVDIQIGVDMPRMVVELEQVAERATLVSGLSLSPSDLTLELGSANHGPRMSKSDNLLLYTRSKILTVARAKGWNAGDFTYLADRNNPDSLRECMLESKAWGFDGVGVGAPKHIPIANDVFGVPADELAWANDFIRKWEEQDNGPKWDRSMRFIDGKGYFAPTYEYARRLVFFKRVLDREPEASALFRQYGLGSEEYLAERRAAPIGAH
jgi:citrate lyase subunit beta/citryl-CoA lyase